MAIELKDTVSLMQAMERIKQPASFLVDTFFPNMPQPAVQSTIAVEYRKKDRVLAPFITGSTKATNMKRPDAKMSFYQPPMVGPRTIVDPEMLQNRGFGEGVYSTVTPAQRATKLQAEDLVFLQGSIMNRKNKMAADLLTTGKYTIEGYADDGKQVITDEVAFDWDQKITPSVGWDQAGAKIYQDLKNASELIQQNAGIVPTICVVGKNVEQYFLDNDELGKFLAIPNLQNLTIASFQPKYISPLVRYVGTIVGLGLEIYSYAETYTDDAGKVQSFIGADDVIIAVPGRGQQLHGAVTLLNDECTGFNTYVAPYVPYYSGDKNSQQLALTMYSRFVIAPQFADDWAYITAKA